MMADALASAEVDAFCVGEPWASFAVERGLAALLLPVFRPHAVMVEHLPHDLFTHPVGQILRDDADNRNIRNLTVSKHMIDARAEREDHFQILESRQGPGRLFPDDCIFNAVVGAAVRIDKNLPSGRSFLKHARPKGTVPARRSEEDSAFFHSLTAPSGAVAMSNAAAMSALV